MSFTELLDGIDKLGDDVGQAINPHIIYYDEAIDLSGLGDEQGFEVLGPSTFMSEGYAPAGNPLDLYTFAVPV